MIHRPDSPVPFVYDFSHIIFFYNSSLILCLLFLTQMFIK
jgi:hypothetical protein